MDKFYLYEIEITIVRNNEVNLVTLTCTTEELLDWIFRCKYEELSIISKKEVRK